MKQHLKNQNRSLQSIITAAKIWVCLSLAFAPNLQALAQQSKKSSAAPPALATQGMDLAQYLKTVRENHRGLAAYEIAQDSALDKKRSGDVELAPIFNLSSTYLIDRSQLNSFGANETRSLLYTGGLQKKFSTGTNLSLAATTDEFKNDTTSLNDSYLHFATANLGLSFTQSLWKDSFGAATSLRHAREDAIYRLDKENSELQIQTVLLNAELAYWDYLYLVKVLQLRQESLARSEKIERWVSRRLSDGIGDRSDLANARALLATRQLALANAQDDIISAEQAIRDFLEIPQGQSTPVLAGDINQKRPVDIYLQGTSGNIVRRQAYVTALQAKVQGISADEIREQLKPDLVLSGKYALTSYKNPHGPTAWDGISYVKDDFSQTSVGLSFNYIFDTEAKTSRIEEAKKEALSARLLKERALLESRTAWSEVVRHYDELSKKINISQDVSKFETERSRTQQDKLSKGRAITSDVVNAEQDAAESELSFLQLSAEQRKMEAASRVYFKTEETL